MRLLLILAFGCQAAVSAFQTLDEDPTRINGENGWYFPSEDGTFFWMDNEKFEDYQTAMENSRGLIVTPTEFYLYTRKNPNKAHEITTTNKSIKKSNFNPDHPTVFIIHGFIQEKDSNMNTQIRDAYLGIGECNVIVVDWRDSKSPYFLGAVPAVPKVGAKVAKMIDYLVFNQKMNIKTVTLVGHSLGAHIAGYAAKDVKAGKLPAIYGLDPALPGFDYKQPNKRLNANDADYVETIQTNGGVFGFLMPIGKASFYANGGEKQPGCIEPICSHELSVDYYAEAVAQNNFASMICENLVDAVSAKCYSSTRMCGKENPLTAEGIYYVPVNKNYPYGVLQ